MAKFSNDPDLIEFVKQLHTADPKPPRDLTRTITAVEQWDDHPRDALQSLRFSGAKGAGQLLVLLRHRHETWAKSAEEYLVGYPAPTHGLMPPTDQTRITDWYECLAEAFALAAFPEELDLDEAKGKDFQQRFRALFERAVRIVVDVERSWARVPKTAPTPGP
jgi:hypothetical protein